MQTAKAATQQAQEEMLTQLNPYKSSSVIMYKCALTLAPHQLLEGLPPWLDLCACDVPAMREREKGWDHQLCSIHTGWGPSFHTAPPFSLSRTDASYGSFTSMRGFGCGEHKENSRELYWGRKVYAFSQTTITVRSEGSDSDLQKISLTQWICTICKLGDQQTLRMEGSHWVIALQYDCHVREMATSY